MRASCEEEGRDPSTMTYSAALIVCAGADEAEVAWLELNAWVNRLRTSYGLAPAVVPPFWHRHEELV